MSEKKPLTNPALPPVERYLRLLDNERQMNRWSRRLSAEEIRPIKEEKEELSKSFSDADWATVKAQSYRSDPAAYDLQEARFDAEGVPIEQRPPRYYHDIPQFPRAHYTVTAGWDYLERQLSGYVESYNLNLNPDFQREHVWTKEQQIAYIEYQLMGGEVGKNIIFNHRNWDGSPNDEDVMEIVDGKQRLEAVRAFLRDEVPAFGRVCSQWRGPMRITHLAFNFSIVSLKKRADLLRLYLNINAGGTPHKPEEIQRVREMLVKELEHPTDPPEVVRPKAEPLPPVSQPITKFRKTDKRRR